MRLVLSYLVASFDTFRLLAGLLRLFVYLLYYRLLRGLIQLFSFLLRQKLLNVSKRLRLNRWGHPMNLDFKSDRLNGRGGGFYALNRLNGHFALLEQLNGLIEVVLTNIQEEDRLVHRAAQSGLKPLYGLDLGILRVRLGSGDF